jgi:hypothetical protein
MFALLLALPSADLPASPDGRATVRAVWLADLHPERVHSGSVGRCESYFFSALH